MVIGICAEQLRAMEASMSGMKSMASSARENEIEFNIEINRSTAGKIIQNSEFKSWNLIQLTIGWRCQHLLRFSPLRLSPSSLLLTLLLLLFSCSPLLLFIWSVVLFLVILNRASGYHSFCSFLFFSFFYCACPISLLLLLFPCLLPTLVLQF